ncbi:MAG: PaaI family thioesterase [Acidobacteria bacterium]|nr:PaaI family thioesterase [Acidobacteriota bacterium]
MPLRAKVQSSCVVCGPENPRGLRIRFEAGADGAITAQWTPTAEWEGFRGIVHGGIVSTVLDEAMSKAVAASHCAALTGELRVRFRHLVESGREFRIRVWIVERRKGLITAEATLTDSDGGECAHAWAAFLTLPEPLEQKLNKERSNANRSADK